MEAQQDTGAFVIAGSFGMDITGAAVSEIHAELERITSTPLTAEELANAKNFLTGYYLLDVGVTEFQEIGPGNVLTKLVAKIRQEAAPRLAAAAER